MENGPGLKMYFLLKMVIFHCYVSLPEGFFATNLNLAHDIPPVESDLLGPAGAFKLLSLQGLSKMEVWLVEWVNGKL